MVQVPSLKRCCFCIPLRPGLIVFAYINIISSIILVTCLFIRTELQKVKLTGDASLELVTSTMLFGILGMGVLLNILLLVAGCQKDIPMLRLYVGYALVTMVASLVPATVLLSRNAFVEVTIIVLFALVMPGYLTILARSEVIKLEEKLSALDDGHDDVDVEESAVTDCVTLL